ERMTVRSGSSGTKSGTWKRNSSRAKVRWLTPAKPRNEPSAIRAPCRAKPSGFPSRELVIADAHQDIDVAAGGIGVGADLVSRIGQFLGQCGFQAGNDDFQLYRQLESVLPVAVQVD